MANYTLYELSVIANAVEHQRQIARDDYTQRMNELDRISRKIRSDIDSLTGTVTEELRERGFYDKEEPDHE